MQARILKLSVVLFMAPVMVIGVGAKSGPKHSWDTMPVFFHSSNSSGPLNDLALDFVAQNFAMATIEKWEGGCGFSADVGPSCHQEKVIIETLRKIKALNPAITTIFYLNSVFDFPQYSVHQRFLDDPSLALHDKSGQVVHERCPYVHKCDVFNHGNPRAQQLFIETCVNATRTGYVDGCFLDRSRDDGNIYDLDDETAKKWIDGHMDSFMKLVDILDGPLIANNDPNKPGPFADMNMIEFFRPTEDHINMLLAAARTGRGVQAHGKEVDESEMAAFLIGAGPNAFYGIGMWYDIKSDADLLSKHWHPAFQWPLGKPLGDAVLDGRVWRRSFVHVNVSFDLDTNKVCASLLW